MKKLTIAAMTIIAIALLAVPAMAFEYNHNPCDGAGCNPGYWTPDETNVGWFKGDLDFRQHQVVDGPVYSNHGNTTYWGSGAEQLAKGWVASGGGLAAETGVFLRESHERNDVPIKGGTGYSEKDMQLVAQASTDATPGKDKAGFDAKTMLDQELVAYKEGGEGWTKLGSDGTLKGEACIKAFADKGSQAFVDVYGREAIGYVRESGPIKEEVAAYMKYSGTVSADGVPHN